MTSVSVARLPAGWAAVELPPMLLARQRFVVPDPVDVGAEVRRQWEAAWSSIGLAPGASVAVAVGSRGIDGLPTVVRTVVDGLKREGCRPFVVPAMGSHGGATAEGQAAVLAERGVTERSVGAPCARAWRSCGSAKSEVCPSSWTASPLRPTASSS